MDATGYIGVLLISGGISVFVAAFVSALVTWLRTYRLESAYNATHEAMEAFDDRLTSSEKRKNALTGQEKKVARKEALFTAAPQIAGLMGNKDMSADEKKASLVRIVTENPDLVDVLLAKFGVKL